jgi:hypothetical protein
MFGAPVGRDLFCAGMHVTNANNIVEKGFDLQLHSQRTQNDNFQSNISALPDL